MSTSYMPNGLETFETWAINFAALVTATPTAYGLVTGDATLLNDALNDYTPLLAISTTPSTRTPVSVQDTRTQFEITRQTFQEIVERAQASGLVSPTEAAALGITDRKTTKTPIVAPTATPSLDIESSTSLAITLRVKELGALNNAIPPNCVGYEVYCLLNPAAPPSTPDNFVLLGTATRRFYTQDFAGTAVGKQCYYAVRYITARQLKGPWSNIVGSTVVST